MPEYTYTDDLKHTRLVFHGMTADPDIICQECGAHMWRLPSRVVGINWNGNAPSQGEPAPDVKHLIDTADERRESYYELKERRDAAEKANQPGA